MVIKIHNLNKKEIFLLIENSVKLNSKITLSYINQYVLIQVIKNPVLKKYFDKSINIIDGIGIYLFLKICNLFKKSKIYRNISTDIWLDLLKYSDNNNYSYMFWGGHKINNNNGETNVKVIFPNLIEIIDGYSINEKNVLNKINKQKPDILFIGLGTPRQEIFIKDNLNEINANVIIPVGSAIDYFTGYKKRAPFWMRKIGLEWLFRLFQEPKRLWKRYILGIPLFIFYVLRQKVKLVLNKTEE